jgi:hypothetical protein
MWTYETKKLTINLYGVTTPIQLRNAFAEPFNFPDSLPEFHDVWNRIWHEIVYQECLYHLQFLHWIDFQQKMPKYAKRMKRQLDEYLRWQPHALIVEYEPGIVASSNWLGGRLKSAPVPIYQPKEELASESHMQILSGSVFQRLNYIVLKPIANPTVEQIRTFRNNILSQDNMLQIRRTLQQGGFCMFGELLDDRAKEISSRLSAAGIPHRIEKTPIRQIIFTEGKKNVNMD